MRPLRSYAATAAAVAVLATPVALAGCGGDDPPNSEPSSSPSGSASPTESSSPSIEPATGKQLRSLSFRVRIPAGWDTMPGQTGSLLTTRYGVEESADGALVGFYSTADGSALVDDPLAKLAREKARSTHFQKPPRILENIQVDGVAMYQVAGPVSRYGKVIAAGAIHDDNLVEVMLESDVMSQQELQAAWDSIMATWQWS